MKPIFVLILFFFIDKVNFVDLTQLLYEKNSNISSSDVLERLIRNKFTRKILVKKRRTSPIIINADNRRNSTRSLKLTKCGSPSIVPNVDFPNSGRIINGKKAFPNSWPWLVSIRQSKYSSLYHVCAGSLVSSQHVVTAAHCVFDYQNSSFAVVVGINNLSEKITLDNTYLITRYIIHPDFEYKTLKNDIAILYLNLPVKFSRKILPICLPSDENKELVYGKTLVVIGWGSTDGFNSQKTLSNRLLQTKLEIRNFKSGPLCKGYDDVNYCALDSASEDSERSNICFGDSGGSLMHQINDTWYLYGIPSFIYGDSQNKKCISSIPSFYTIVPKYLNWILNYIN